MRNVGDLRAMTHKAGLIEKAIITAMDHEMKIVLLRMSQVMMKTTMTTTAGENAGAIKQPAPFYREPALVKYIYFHKSIYIITKREKTYLFFLLIVRFFNKCFFFLSFFFFTDRVLTRGYL